VRLIVRGRIDERGHVVILPRSRLPEANSSEFDSRSERSGTGSQNTRRSAAKQHSAGNQEWIDSEGLKTKRYEFLVGALCGCREYRFLGGDAPEDHGSGLLNSFQALAQEIGVSVPKLDVVLG